MTTNKLALGSVVEDPDFTRWEIVDDLPDGVVRELVFSRALGAPLGPCGAALMRHMPMYESWARREELDAHWRDGAAVVVMVNSVTREVHAIVRHGPTFRLIRLRTAQ